MRYCWFAIMNKGPSFEPLTAKYGRSAVTGHTDSLVLLNIKVTPFLKGSVLDCLILMEISCGSCQLSTDTSL